MLPEGVQGWFDAPVFAWFVSNAVWIGADDVLTRIDALMDWQWCSPTRKRGLGCVGIGPQGYVLVRFNCLLIGQWHGPAARSWSVHPQLQLDFMLFCGLDLLCTCAR